MSHFTVLVIGDNPEEQLAPFQENNMGDCPEEYLEFFDDEEAYRNEYEHTTMHAVRSPSGEVMYRYDERFEKNTADGLEIVIPPDHEILEVPISELYKTFDDYMENYYGTCKDKETGKYGYWENPRAKWDWYSLGGRWNNFFILKPGARGNAGEVGLGSGPAIAGHADQALKKDIDWKSMQQRSEIEAIKNWYEAEGMSEEQRLYSYDIHEGEPREDYIERRKKSSYVTFAVLMDGEWHQRGELHMYMFGAVSNEKDPEDWYEIVNNLIDSLPDDTLLSVYDCHI